MRGLDIFAGAGGSSAGARLAGVEMVAGIDMCAIASQTYGANFPKAHAINDRLENVDLAALKKKVGTIDILFASPECTNHTCAKGAAPRDEASRATAMYAVEYAKTFKPRWLVLENVVHMRPWSRYPELKRELIDMGYKLREQILDASDFGVAQSRRRLFLICDKVKEPASVSISRRGKKPSVKSILDPAGKWTTSLLYTDNRAAGTVERAERGFKALGKKASFLLVYYGSDGSGGWQALDRPLRTITTVDRFALVEPGKDGPTMRMLQVPELKRAMGYIDTHQFGFGTRRDKVRLLGNGVCPPVMESVVRCLTS